MNAQLLKKIKNRVQTKMEQKVEDKVVEEVSEEIARRAMRPINRAIDQMLAEAYKEEYGEEYDASKYEGDPERRAEVLGSVLANVYGTVELPERYEFSYRTDIQVKDYSDKNAIHAMSMFLAPESRFFGISQTDDGDAFMILDMKNDLAVAFNKKEKSVIAIKGVASMASVLAASQAMENHMSVHKEKLTKVVAGHQSTGYGYDTKEEYGEFYLSTDLPFEWGSSFASLYEEMFSELYENDGDYSGMLMYSESIRKVDGKKSIWEVTKVDEITESVNTAEYRLINAAYGQ